MGDNRGETLIEVLASILIAALSAALLFNCIVASSRIEKRAETMGTKHYSAISEADTQTAPTPTPDPETGAVPVLPTGNVTVSRVEPDPSDDPTPTPLETATPPIAFYGGEGMFSYKR